MVVVSNVLEMREHKHHDEYWKIHNYDARLVQTLETLPNNHHYKVPSSSNKAILAKAASRATRGLLRYENYKVAELRQFCNQRDLKHPNLSKPSKSQLIQTLEEPDEHKVFRRLMDLPPELRLLIYTLYFKSLPDLEEPTQPPISRVCRLVRQESLPLFFSTCTFIISTINWRGRGLHRLKFFDEISDNHLKTIRNSVYRVLHRWPGTQKAGAEASKCEILHNGPSKG